MAFMMRFPALVVALRQLLVQRYYWRNFVVARTLEPMVTLFGLGLGLGVLLPRMGGVDYVSFVVPGIVCSAIMFSALIEGSYICLTRYKFQQTWGAMLATPARVRDIMLGETLAIALKAVVLGLILATVGSLFGAHLNWLGVALALPMMMLLAASLIALGYVAASVAKGYEDFDYLWAGVLTPSMMFSGLMIDPKVFPEWLFWLAQVLPMTHGLAAIRATMLGQWDWLIVIHLLVLLAMTLACMKLAERFFQQRLLA
jgi:lipooligosaccharide transport system permease protein